MKMYGFIAVLVVALPVAFAANTHAATDVVTQELLLSLPEDAEVAVQRYPASGESLVIWLAPESGVGSVNRDIAVQLANQGIEVWLADLIEAHFLPGTRSSLYKLPASDVVTLIQTAYQQTNKAIYLMGAGAGIIPLLRGAHAWQLNNTRQGVLKGVIVNSPDFYVGTPNPGEKPQLLPIVSHTSLPVFILQPKQSPRYWQLADTVPELERAGSDVYVRILRGVRGGFHIRKDAVPLEKAVTLKLAGIIRQSITLLNSAPLPQQKTRPLTQQPPDVPENKKDRKLASYRGDPVPPPLKLQSLKGDMLDLSALKGQVVLVNFWTTWCPPCVHEMPSLQLLQDAFERDRFLVLGVNMAEDEATIHDFLRNKVTVDFPIVLDRDGAALRQWQVHAFPTSFVVDKNNRIRYALFGSIQWDTPDIIDKIRELTNESQMQ